MKKHTTILLFMLVAVILTQSCEKNLRGYYKNTFVEGYVIDSLSGEPIENVKLEIKILEIEGFSSGYIDTGLVTYSDASGFYKFEFKNIDEATYLFPTHNDYIFTKNEPTVSWGLKNELNITMLKRGKVKIEGDAVCYNDDPFWLDSVKISVLKRKIGNNDYPITAGVEAYTNDEGKYYLEFEGDENYEFFLKPEKEGYFYERYDLDYVKTLSNTDPGYTMTIYLEMQKEN